MPDAMMAVSPVDGRYARYTTQLGTIVSEYGLIRYRVQVMVYYLIALIDCEELGITHDKDPGTELLKILHLFSPEDAYAIKQLETKGWNGIPATNHDVKSCELWLRFRVEQLGFAHLVEWIHFGKTSEDVNNIAYGLMLRDVMVPHMDSLEKLLRAIEDMATRYADLAMLSRTHGQAATPTTFGKECAVFAGRLRRPMKQMGTFVLTLKLNGASGNYAAMRAARPDIDWPTFAKKFIESGSYIRGGAYIKFEQNPLTTQIEPHDTYVELFDIIKRANGILVDFAQDMWRYISDDWVVQKPVSGEVGSSAMPHKVNPIQFENAEGNLILANGVFETINRKVQVSRLQRDLSDSTVERNFGVAFSHCIIAYENLYAGLQKVSPNHKAITDALMKHPEVLTEAIQTMLRSVGYPNAYDALKTLARGNKITLMHIHDFINGLDEKYVDHKLKKLMKELRRETYIGYAPELARSL